MRVPQNKPAKRLGKKLRVAREEQGCNLAILASQCGMSVVQLVALEDGNVYIFDEDQNQMYESAIVYAEALGINVLDKNILDEVVRTIKKEWIKSIPHLLDSK
jgi:transcriptional regulator with XRE-family HTH domain